MDWRVYRSSWVKICFIIMSVATRSDRWRQRVPGVLRYFFTYHTLISCISPQQPVCLMIWRQPDWHRHDGSMRRYQHRCPCTDMPLQLINRQQIHRTYNPFILAHFAVTPCVLFTICSLEFPNTCTRHITIHKSGHEWPNALTLTFPVGTSCWGIFS